jgi:hypothetical protein
VTIHGGGSCLRDDRVRSLRGLRGVGAHASERRDTIATEWRSTLGRSTEAADGFGDGLGEAGDDEPFLTGAGLVGGAFVEVGTVAQGAGFDGLAHGLRK